MWFGNARKLFERTMPSYPEPLDLSRLRVYPLDQRKSLTTADEILIDPDSQPAPIDERIVGIVGHCARKILLARQQGATVMLAYGAHLLRNGAAAILEKMMERGWLTHLATNGAGTIHDWEYAFLGRSTESVRDNVATGTFGTWDETGRYLHLAMMVGGLEEMGYGQSLGRFIHEDGVDAPHAEALTMAIEANPQDPQTAARADLLQAMIKHAIPSGRMTIRHQWKQASILSQAFRLQVPVSIHPGIGYDIISNHPIFNGAVIGRAATIDFRLFSRAVEGLEGGVMLSVGSAIMAPQVFEKSLSCVNNLRLQNGRQIVHDHEIYVVDIQDGGGWDWSQGEPPKTNPAYYLRFCKSFSRMGGKMHYAQCDNLAFMHHLYRALLAG
ncbi:MAG: hypothetical protein M2R45_03819 [Verrucomicrobia subdivision 3 bacterium]|nr:hypothetical protein [Limisphaerales bacterium]MCS1415775.1 hypothetical protein [Limisphaerales bacterium]